MQHSVSEFQQGPIAAKQRIEVLDVIRGFALLGIFLMNIEWFSRPIALVVMAVPEGLQGIDRWAGVLVYLLVQGKFFFLFSLLFGMGFALMFDRAASAQTGFWGPYLRRTLVLALFGIAHISLMWSGDILLLYAVAALLMMIFVKVRGKALVIVGSVVYLLAAAFTWLGGWALSFAPASERAEVRQDLNVSALVDPNVEGIFRHGDFFQVAAQRWVDYQHFADGYLTMFLILVAAIFIMGMWLIRSGLMIDSGAQQTFFKRVALVGFPIAILLTWYSASIGVSFNPEFAVNEQLKAMGSMMVANLFWAFAYLSVLVLLFHGESTNKLVSWLAPAGRMALTNYLMQSLIASLLFYGYGFGLYGEIGRAGQVAIVFIVFIAQVLFSHWWLARYQFGPMEWIWRAATYLQLPAMRR